MRSPIQTPAKPWTPFRAISLMVACLFLGAAGGWVLRAWQSPAFTGTAKAAVASTAPQTNPAPSSQAQNPARLKQIADAQVALQLQQLKSNPNDANLLISIGNTYYDAQQYPVAVEFYGRALKVKPADAAVRTDMATAYWYMGETDIAITEFNKALTLKPNNASTLFNLGLVKWKGKMDIAGAVADWQKLLATNPNYEERDKVGQMIADAEEQAGSKPQ